MRVIERIETPYNVTSSKRNMLTPILILKLLIKDVGRGGGEIICDGSISSLRYHVKKKIKKKVLE